MNQDHLLSPFLTNLDKPVFCLKNLPEVVKGALFSRYSRSEKGLREILLDEFINAPEAYFQELSGDAEILVNKEQAEAFYDRVLLGYGDDSIAELGGAHIACEGISNIAAKALEDCRIGISPLEKSTRYVRFDQKKDGKYLYYRELLIMASIHSDLYEETMDLLFKTYSDLIAPLSEWLKTKYPKNESTKEKPYLNSIKAKALDILRGLLPMATLTNVGLYGNGRSLEYLLVKFAASRHIEVRQLGVDMQEELKQVIPSFIKGATTERGQRQSQRIIDSLIATRETAEDLVGGLARCERTDTVCLTDYEPYAVTQVITAILYPHSDLCLSRIAEAVIGMAQWDKEAVINEYVGDRHSRFDKVGRAFEEVFYTFDILADIGAYRDLQRHRLMSQEHQDYTVKHGYDVPDELVEATLDEPYRRAMNAASFAFEIVESSLPIAAQYMVPFGCKIRWKIKLNLREAYHFIELRSQRQGHSSYREIAQQMYLAINDVHPELAAHMIIDMKDYDLERLAAEQKTEAKRGEA